MTIVAFISSLRFGRLIDDCISSKGRIFSVTKVCGLKRQRRRRVEPQKTPEPVKRFENKYEDQHWYEPVPHLDRTEALFYTRLAVPASRGRLHHLWPLVHKFAMRPG